MKNLNEMSSKELKQLAKEKHIKNWWSSSKAVLIAALEETPDKQWEDKCDDCDKPAAVKQYENQLLCNECITEIEAVEAKIEAAEIVKEVNTEDQPKKLKKQNLKIKEITYKDKTQTIKEWANELNMPWPTLYDRINRNGWSIEEAIEIPLGKRRPKTKKTLS